MARRVLLSPWLLTGCLVVPVLYASWPYTVDDAFILVRYAERLAAGQGYTFNPGIASDGVTGPVWLLPAWVGALFHATLPVAKVCGLASSATACVLVSIRARRSSGGAVACLLLACALSVSLPLGVWSVAGLETGFAALCATSMVLAATARPCAHSGLLGVSIALAAWTRPELAVLAAACLGVLLVRGGHGALRVLLPVSASVFALILFRLRLFGAALPLSYYAKQPDLAVGVSYAARSLLGVWSLPGVIAAAWLLARGRRDERLWIALSCAHVLGVALAGGDWMPAARLLVPIVPVSFLAFAVATARAWRLRRRAALGGWLLGVAWLAGGVVRELPALRRAGAESKLRGDRLVAVLAQGAGPIALVDVGRVGAELERHEIIDLGGLTDADVARMPGGHLDKRPPARWIEGRAPCQIVVHTKRPPLIDREGRLRSRPDYPVEARIGADDWVRSSFRVTDVVPFAQDYYYVVLRHRPSFGGDPKGTVGACISDDRCASPVRAGAVRWHH